MKHNNTTFFPHFSQFPQGTLFEIQAGDHGTALNQHPFPLILSWSCIVGTAVQNFMGGKYWPSTPDSRFSKSGIKIRDIKLGSDLIQLRDTFIWNELRIEL